MKNSAAKVLIGFIIGAVSVGGYAIATPNNVPVVKACIDNKTKIQILGSLLERQLRNYWSKVKRWIKICP